MQEASFAKNIRAFCGPNEVHLDNALRFATFMLNSRWDQVLYDLGRGLPYGYRNGVSEAVSLIQWWGYNFPAGGFGVCIVRRSTSLNTRKQTSPLENTRQREATDPKVKILAPLAFALVPAKKFAHADILNNVLKLFNYRSTLSQLYQDFTTLMANSSSRLDILSQVDGDKSPNIESLPSWVPDYSTSFSGTLLDGTSFYATKFLSKARLKHHQGWFGLLIVSSSLFYL